MKKFLPHLMAVAMIAAMILVVGCMKCPKESDEFYLAKEEIAKLAAVENVLEQDVRDAVEPAKTVETDITNYFNFLFERGEIEKLSGAGSAKNIVDSAKVFIYVVEAARKEVGNPLPTNETTMTNLYNKSQTYIGTVDDLEWMYNNAPKGHCGEITHYNTNH